MRIQTTFVVTALIIAMAIVPCFSVMADDQPRKEILDGTWTFPEVKPVASK